MHVTTHTDRRLADLLSRAEHRVSQRLATALRREGVHLDQWRVLSTLSDGAGRTMSEIAGHVMTPPATLTRLIDRMVEANLVYRRSDDVDRRRVLVFISARGHDAYRRLSVIIDREQEALEALFGERQGKELADLLAELIERL